MINAGNDTLWMHAGEIHQHNSRGELIGIWRLSGGKWQHRTGWGAEWQDAERPTTVDLQLVQKLEAA
jgi:hypothetical protein